MDIAIITGADTRFGDSVARTLLRMGFRVYALGKGLEESKPDSRYYNPCEHSTGDLSGLRNQIQEVLQKEGRIDLLLSLGHLELDNKWDTLKAEVLVRRLHGCLTEVLLASHICLPHLRKQKGFWIHVHRRSRDADKLNRGFFESSIEEIQDDLQKRYERNGLRVARILSSFPESSLTSDPIQQDLTDSISRALEVILRQKETCVIREMFIDPRVSSDGGNFPNLVPDMDQYQNTVLPAEADNKEPEPILIPTEKPKHYIQIAEVEEVDSRDKGNSTDTEKGSTRKPQRRGNRSRRRKPQHHEEKLSSPGSEAPQEKEARGENVNAPASSEVSSQDKAETESIQKKKTTARKVARKRTSRRRKPAPPKPDLDQKGEATGE